MMALRTLLSRLRDLRHKDALDLSLDDEVRFHLEMQTAENIRRGMAPEEARYAALRQFGGVEQRKEEWRELRFLPRLESLWQDVRHAARSVIRARGFAVFAILSLALGIGANTAVFLMVRTLVLRPLPYPQPRELVQLYESMVWMGSQTWGSVSAPNLLDWRRHATSFASLGAYAVGGVNLSQANDTLRLPAGHLEAEVFQVLGIRPLLGRTFLPEENRAGRNRVAVLSYGLWQRRFGADPAVIGTKVGINGAESTVVGVMPEGFRFPPRSSLELWTPLVLPDWALAERGDHWLNVVARLKPGVGETAAQLEMNSIARRLSGLHRENTTRGVRIQSLHGETARATTGLLLVLSFAVSVVMLLACANVAHLVLARTAARRRELALRAALGASRWRVARLAFLEGLLLAAAGAASGLLAASWSLEGLLRMARRHLPVDFSVDWDWTVVAFCTAAAAFTAVLSGLIPSLTATRIDLQSALKEAGSASGHALSRKRSLLMVWEIALALILVAGALLLFRSLQVYNRIDLGFDHERVLTMKISLPETRYPTPRDVTGFFHRALSQLQSLPGVSESALINLLPVSEPYANSNFSIRGRRPSQPGHEPAAEHRLITHGYFRAMGIPLVSGRLFIAEDMEGPVRTVIVNQRAADLYWPGENPVGQWVAIGTEPKPGSWMQVVGVVANVRHAGPYRPHRTALYLPISRTGTAYAWPTMNLVVRSDRAPQALTNLLRQQIRALDPDVAVHQPRTMSAIVDEAVSGTRLLARLLTLFSALAILLALAGVYGVMACLVAERTHEIGVRMSLGATRGKVLGMVLTRGLRTGLTGVALGIVWTVPLIALARHYLVGVGFAYVWTFSAAGLGLLAITLLASLEPAWRASTVDPLVALRDE